MTDSIEIVRNNKVLEVKLNKPKVNAIDLELSRALGDAFAELRNNDELRAGIVTGAGEKIFSAGWDLKALDRGDAKLDEWWDETGLSSNPGFEYIHNHPLKLVSTYDTTSITWPVSFDGSIESFVENEFYLADENGNCFILEDDCVGFEYCEDLTPECQGILGIGCGNTCPDGSDD